MAATCNKCGVRFFTAECPKCSREETAQQLHARMKAAGVQPLFSRPSDADSERPLRLTEPAAMARHGLSQPAVMCCVSEWTSGAPAGTHDGLRDGAQQARCLRRLRVYYPLAD